MVNELELIRGNDIVINNNITIHHPSLQNIYDYGEENYFLLLSNLLATPYDYKVQLWDAGVDYTTVDTHILFFERVRMLPQIKSSILFGNYNFIDCVVAENMVNNQIVLVNKQTKAVIDIAIYNLIIDCLKKMHSITKEEPNAGNKETKMYFIERDRRLQERHQNKPFESHLYSNISSLVNSVGFKYDYQSVWQLPIFQFYDALSRINHIKYCDNILAGIYSGNVDSSKINNESINWAAKL